VSEFSSSEWPHWNALTPTFKGSYSLTDERVYNSAGEIWPSALKYARRRSVEESEAREELLRAVATVSTQELKNIKTLSSYLFKSYARRIQKILIRHKHYASLESVNQELSSNLVTAEAMEDHLLLAEIVARMDEEMRTIHEGLILGYTFEEIGKKLGKSSNYLRSRFSKGVKRIAREVRDPELSPEG
jgi:DNA-directed RNA polymerase specialized sigma24 family protein